MERAQTNGEPPDFSFEPKREVCSQTTGMNSLGLPASPVACLLEASLCGRGAKEPSGVEAAMTSRHQGIAHSCVCVCVCVWVCVGVCVWVCVLMMSVFVFAVCEIHHPRERAGSCREARTCLEVPT